jgi:hypothetical protein
MAAALTELEWRRNAAKMVVLIADAPPHGQSHVAADDSYLELTRVGIGEWGDREWESGFSTKLTTQRSKVATHSAMIH